MLQQKISFIQIAVIALFLVGVAASCTMTGVSAGAPFKVSCMASPVKVSGGSYPNGIEVDDTHADSNCKITIEHSTTLFIDFVEAVSGDNIEIDINNNTFLAFDNDNNVVLPAPNNVPSAVAFEHGIGHVLQMRIRNNRWTTNATYAQGVTFLTFASNVGNVLSSLSITGNQWLATVPNPVPFAVPAPTVQHTFVTFSGPVNTNNGAIVVSGNVWTQSSAVSRYPVQFLFLMFGSDVSYTPLTVSGNTIALSTYAYSTKATYRLTYVAGDTTSAPNHHAISVADNQVTMFAASPGKYQPLEVVLHQFDGDIIRSEKRAPGEALNQLEFYRNIVEISGMIDGGIIYMLSLQGAVQLASLNVSGNFFGVNWSPAITAAFTNVIWFNNAIAPAAQDPSFGVINVTGNELRFDMESLGQAMTAEFYWLTLPENVPGNDPNAQCVIVKDVDLSFNVLKVSANCSAASGIIKIWWLAIPPPNAYTNKVFITGPLSVSGNAAVVFAVAQFVEQYLVVSKASLNVSGAVTLDANDGFYIFPAADVGCGLFSAVGNIAMASVSAQYNSVDLYRFSCVHSGMHCPDDPGVGLPLSFALLLISGEENLIIDSKNSESKLLLHSNEIRIHSNAIFPFTNNDNSARDKRMGVFLFLATGKWLDIYENVFIDNNVLLVEIFAPATPPPVAQGISTLFRVPVALLAVLPLAQTAATRDFHFEQTSLFSNYITAACAPCMISAFMYNASGPDSFASVRILELYGNGVEADVPPDLYPQHFSAQSDTDYYVVVSQMMLCVPAGWAFPFGCTGRSQLFSVSLDIAPVSVDAGNTVVKLPERFGVKADYCGDRAAAAFPDNFGENSFRMALIIVDTGSFPNVASAKIALRFSANKFFWGLSVPGWTQWFECLSQRFVTSVFTAGEHVAFGTNPIAAQMQVVLPYVTVSVECSNQLGGSMESLLSLTQTKWTNGCITSTAAPSTAPLATTSITSITTLVPAPSDGAPTTQSPDANNDANHTGANAGNGGGLSGGATAAIVILLLIAVALTGAFCYLRWPQVKNTMRPLFGGGEGSLQSSDLAEAGTGGYGSVRDSELQSRRMSLASSSASSFHEKGDKEIL